MNCGRIVRANQVCSMFLRFASLALVAAMLPASAFAGDLSGSVIDARGLPVAGIEVTLGEGEQRALTDADGRYAFADVAAGEASLAVKQANGDVQRAFAQVAEDGATRRDIYLISARALSIALGAAEPEPEIDADLEATLRLAETMAADATAERAVSWAWNDREA